MGTAAALGIKAYQASPEARRPADVTMPAAVNHDFQQQQSRFGSMIRLIQQAPIGFDADDSDRLHPEAPAYDHGDPHECHDIDDELNRSAIAPVRWV